MQLKLVNPRTGRLRGAIANCREDEVARAVGLNNPDQLRRCNELLHRSNAALKEAGPCLLAADEDQGFWRPTMVLAELPDEDPAVTEEVFGPVLTVQRTQDLEAAVRMTNSRRQALAASVWSRDLRSALEIVPRLNAGEVWVNCHMVQTAELPHGGRGASGSGTDLSTLALHEYQRPKTVTVRVERLGRDLPRRTI